MNNWVGTNGCTRIVPEQPSSPVWSCLPLLLVRRNPLAFAAKLSAPERVMLLTTRACQRSRPNAVHGEPLEGYTALGWIVKRKRWMELQRVSTQARTPRIWVASVLRCTAC